jgi:hypothetical protein
LILGELDAQTRARLDDLDAVADRGEPRRLQP